MKEQPPNQASDAPETEPFFVPGFRPWRVPQASYAQAKERSQTWPKEKTKERKKYTVWIRIDISRKVRDVREGCGAYPKNFASRDTLRPLCFVLRDLQAAVECEALCFASGCSSLTPSDKTQTMGVYAFGIPGIAVITQSHQTADNAGSDTNAAAQSNPVSVDTRVK